MTIEELEDKHRDIEIFYFNSIKSEYPEQTKLSIEFTISVLEELNKDNELSFLDKDLDKYLENKIQEFKTYLNEKGN